MDFQTVVSRDEAQGQATYGMANLRTKTTGLPFVVFISQKDAARHDVRVKVAPGARVNAQDMGSYQLRPFGHTDGRRLDPREERLLQTWIAKNIDVLVAYWDGRIEFTEDAIEQLQPL